MNKIAQKKVHVNGVRSGCGIVADVKTRLSI